jgi:hypothetical protein
LIQEDGENFEEDKMNRRFTIFESVTIIFIFIFGMMAGNALTISSKPKDIKIDDGRIVCSKALAQYYQYQYKNLAKQAKQKPATKLMKVSQRLENSRY